MGHTASTPQLTPFTSPSSLVVSHKHAVTEEEAHKLLLLEVLFKSIDDKSQQWVDRQTITDWVRMEPYLQRDDTRPEAQRMLNKLSHDEDSSRCTYREFVLAFIAFTTDEVRALVINLLRSASSDRPSVLDHLTAGESERAAGYTDVHDEKDSRTLFLLNSIFDAMDVDGVDHVTAAQLHHWLDSDPFFDQPEQADLRQTINQLTHRHYAEGASSPSSSSSPPLPRHVFLSTLSSLARRHVKLLLIHLLRRTTAHVVKAAKLQRKRSIVAHHRVSMSSGSLPSMASLTSSPSHPDPFDENPALQREAEDGERAEQDEAMSVLPSHHLLRRHSILIGGYKRRSTMDGLRLTLLGQSMIQHDLRETDRGRDCLSSLRASLFGDVIFSELESAILTEDMQATPTRNTVFFHAARPSVIDCLQELNVNLLGLSNNHTGDLGPEGVYTLIKEMDARGLVYAGIGANLAQAASPRYLDTANGRIGLVSFASKVPIGSDATADRPGVNHVLMADVDSQKLNKADVRRVVDAVVDARSEADVVVAYHHNHYWEKSIARQRGVAHGLVEAEVRAQAHRRRRQHLRGTRGAAAAGHRDLPRMRHLLLPGQPFLPDQDGGRLLRGRGVGERHRAGALPQRGGRRGGGGREEGEGRKEEEESG